MTKIRAEITKKDELRYISHLDYAAALERALRRAKLPIAFSEGFNPHIKMAFASALAVGVTSGCEYVDIEFTQPLTAAEFMEKLRPSLPDGIDIVTARVMTGKVPSLMAQMDLAVYEARGALTGSLAEARRSLAAFNESAVVTFMKITPKARKEIDLKLYVASPLIISETAGEAVIEIKIKNTPQGSAKPSDILKALVEKFALPMDLKAILIHRVGLYAAGRKLID